MITRRRVALAGLVAVQLCGGTTRAFADDRLVIKTDTYVDSDSTSVVRPMVRASKDLIPDRLEVGVSYSVDVISTASIDVITNATAPEFEDRRKSTGARIQYQGSSNLKLGTSFTHSTETDYTSNAVAVTATRDFLQRNVTVAGRAGYVRDVVGSTIDPQFEEPLRGWGYALNVSQVLSRRLVLRLGFEGAYLSGYQQSPYRHVRFGDFQFRFEDDTPVFDGVTDVQLEHHPDERLRQSLSAGAAWRLGRRGALHPSYQFYLDSWGVMSHKVELQYLYQPTAGLVLRGRYRFYRQGKADFYEKQYRGDSSTRHHFSADKRLGRMRAHLLGGRVEYSIAGPQRGRTFERLGVDAKVDLIRNAYPDYLFLEHRSALVVQFGLFVEL